MRLLDGLARTAMLVLAGLATLSLIGSLASVSSSALGDAFPGRIAADAPPEDAAPVDMVITRTDDTERGASAPTITGVTAAQPAPSPGDIAITRWLKALTYAVVALAAIGAAGVIALVRIGSRIAPA